MITSYLLLLPFLTSISANNDDNGRGSSSTSTSTSSSLPKDPSTPIWPDQWHATFSIEWWGNALYRRSTNGGSYHYDFKNGMSLEEHGKGQQDNWCGCASNESVECKIIAFNDDPNSLSNEQQEQDQQQQQQRTPATYVVMPTLDVCCKLFEGEGTLLPDWMRTNTFEGYEQGGSNPTRQCEKWLNPHPGNALLMTGDLWMLDDDGIPCGYRDVFKWWAKRIFGYGHYFTFDRSTYSTDEESGEVFALPGDPADCNVPCPNRDAFFKPWCKASWQPDAVGGDGEL